jgi:environmental stress-induced protein Ves
MPGPFSNFPGYDRLLILLPGDSVILNSVEHHPSQPIMFKGEDSTYCELKGRPVRDLGLIFRRDLVSATLNVHTLLTGESSLELDSYWNFLYVATGGPIKIDSVLLYQNDILLVTQNQNLRVEAHGPASVYYFAIRLINTL